MLINKFTLLELFLFFLLFCRICTFRKERIFLWGCNSNFQCGSKEKSYFCLNFHHEDKYNMPVSPTGLLHLFPQNKTLKYLCNKYYSTIVYQDYSIYGFGRAVIPNVDIDVPTLIKNESVKIEDVFCSDSSSGYTTKIYGTEEKNFFGFGMDYYHLGRDLRISITYVPRLLKDYVKFSTLDSACSYYSNDSKIVYSSGYLPCGRRNENNYYSYLFQPLNMTNMNITNKNLTGLFSNSDSSTRNLLGILYYEDVDTLKQDIYLFGTYANFFKFNKSAEDENIPFRINLQDHLPNESEIIFINCNHICAILFKKNDGKKDLYTWGGKDPLWNGRPDDNDFNTTENFVPLPISIGEMTIQERNSIVSFIFVRSLYVNSMLILVDSGKLFGFGRNYNLAFTSKYNIDFSVEHPVLILDRKIRLMGGFHFNNHFGFIEEDHGCFSFWKDDPRVCSGGNGICVDDDKCECLDGYKGKECEYFSCENIYPHENDIDICLTRGICLSHNNCYCKNNFFGNNCEINLCFEHFSNESTSCSGNGNCIDFNLCKCVFGYISENCEVNFFFENIIVFVYIPVSVILGIVCLIGVLIVIILICSRTQTKTIKKFEELKDFEILLEEQKVRQKKNIMNLKINKDLFEIDFKNIKLLKLIGQGSERQVFKSSWKGLLVSVKISNSTDLFSTPTNNNSQISKFEKEVTLLSSISHPCLEKFYGAFFQKSKFGFVMELCMNDLKKFMLIKKFNQKENTFKIEERIRIIYECALGIEYLHDRKIIHRDLKPENILLRQDLTSCLTDFGLSKITSKRDTFHTKRIGTSYYMSPEITLGRNYSGKTDVFSYAISSFEIITFKDAFKNQSNNASMEIIIATNPNVRPKIKDEDFEGNKWLIELLTKCWNHNEEKRPSFSEIVKIIKDNFNVNDIFKNKSNNNEVNDNNDLIEKKKKMLLEIKMLKKEYEKIKKNKILEKIVEEEKTVIEIEKLSEEEDKPILEEEKLAIEKFDEKEKKKSVEEEKPKDEKLSKEEDKPIIEDEKLSEEEDKPIIEDEKLSEEEDKPIIEEEKLAIEKIDEKEKKKSVEEEKPKDEEKSEEEYKPIIEEEKLAIEKIDEKEQKKSSEEEKLKDEEESEEEVKKLEEKPKDEEKSEEEVLLEEKVEEKKTEGEKPIEEEKLEED